VVASPEARFGAAFLKVGLMPDTGIIWTLPRRVGAVKSRELMMLASEIKGDDALRIGLVNQLAEKDGVLAAAIEVAAKLAKQPRMALASLKSALGEGNDSPDAALRVEIDHGAALLIQRQSARPRAKVHD